MSKQPPIDSPESPDEANEPPRIRLDDLPELPSSIKIERGEGTKVVLEHGAVSTAPPAADLARASSDGVSLVIDAMTVNLTRFQSETAMSEPPPLPSPPLPSGTRPSSGIIATRQSGASLPTAAESTAHSHYTPGPNDPPDALPTNATPILKPPGLSGRSGGGSNDPTVVLTGSGSTNPWAEPDFSGTRVDLGDDLLEHTAVTTRAPMRESVTASDPEPGTAPAFKLQTRTEIEDQIESARILVGEGFLEDAKRILRRIMLGDPTQVMARKRLEEIHELELRQILSGTETRRPRTSRDDGPKARAIPSAMDSERVMQSLDRDLRLGALEPLLASEAEQDWDAYALRLETELGVTTPRDRLDLGIAFLEMGVTAVAIVQFRSALAEPTLAVSAISLLAYALIIGGRPFEAVLTLEPVLGDTDLTREDKLDFTYLMGRAHEQLDQLDVAIQWYQRTLQIQAGYRDADERWRRLKC